MIQNRLATAAAIFSSPDAFRRAFSDGLPELLRDDGLGAFILVCANATYDPAIYAATSARLRAKLDALRERHVKTLADGRPITDADEDLLVFLKILALGFERLNATEKRRAGPWLVQFNHLRAFRPQRISRQTVSGLQAPFDAKAFHFNKGFLQKEAFWSGELGGKAATLYYNKYPFAELHALLVPEREKQLPQFLTRPYHDYVWQLAETLGRSLEGLGFGYNAYGAFASVNHLHFQLFADPQELPAASPDWRHNGGAEDYPAACEVFRCEASAWRRIEDLHRRQIAYNLLYRPGKLYVFPRQTQGVLPTPAWSSGFTWYEMAGGMLSFNRDDYAKLDEAEISAELKKLAVSV
ncbi:MAG: hypothetical protein K8F27_02780 [Sulfuricellaceae bacterium]|nr:hypothetical protein [Sulfuricellaceae bacterium]